jgi:hypothetical protein
MALFGGREDGERPSRIPLARDEPVERWQRRLAGAGLRFVGIKQTESGTYQTLACDDAEQAKDFLRQETVEREQYYLVVETPDGNWGADINGLFLEKLLPWQTDTAASECRGRLRGLIGGSEGILAAAHGWVDNFLVEVACGRCDHEWTDGIRLRDATVVRCPACRARNLVDSGLVTYTEFG